MTPPTSATVPIWMGPAWMDPVRLAPVRLAPVLATAVMLSAALVLGGCSLPGGNGADSKGASAKGGGAQKAGPGGRAPKVIVSTVEATDFVDSMEAVGTAFANEQADLNSTVTERVARINFSDGQYVPRGAIIAELVRSEQGANLNASNARLREAELQLERLKQLQSQGFATNARVDEQQAAVNVARAQSAQATSQIGDRVIRAPFSGWLSLRRISPGTVVNAGTTIVTIVDHSKIKLDFTVPETFLPALKPGLEISANAAAYPGEEFRGTIATIDPLIDPVTRSATARAILPNPDLRLRPGMLMTVDIKSAPRTALTVPELAVVGEGTSSYVWRVSDDNQAMRVPITPGTRRDGRIEVVSGLSEGDRVVSEGTVKIRGPGPVDPVETARPAARPAAAPEAKA